MPRYSYLNFEVDSDDMNVPGSSDVTKPSEGWKGRDVNDALRASNSAIRDLGEITAKLPTDANGIPILGPDQGKIGTAAFQNAETFTTTGGVLGPNVRGSVGFGTLLMIFCNSQQLPGVIAEQRTRGFELCDGATKTNPYPPFNQTTLPPLLGLFPWFTNNSLIIGQRVFGFSPDPSNDAFRTVNVGNHAHGDATGGTTLGYNELPPVVIAVSTQATPGANNSGGNRDLDVTVVGNSAPHAHTIGQDGAHSFTLDIRPPAICVLPFLRVW